MATSAYQLRREDVLAFQILWRATLIVLGLFLAIAVAAAVQTELQPGAVTRIALKEVPVEKVVEFGHQDGAFTMALPVPADPVERPVARGYTQATALRPDDTRRLSAYVEPDRNGVLPIDFSLGQGNSSATGGVGVTKNLASDKGAMTGLTIFLVGGSIIEIDRGELVLALTTIGASERSAALPSADPNGRLSLDRLRQAGVDLRYDAIRDRLVLNP